MKIETVLTRNALTVLERRYLKKDAEGHVIETPEELFARVARNVASAESNYASQGEEARWQETFYDVMTSLSFLPNSPTLMNAETDLQQLWVIHGDMAVTVLQGPFVVESRYVALPSFDQLICQHRQYPIFDCAPFPIGEYLLQYLTGAVADGESITSSVGNFR